MVQEAGECEGPRSAAGSQAASLQQPSPSTAQTASDITMQGENQLLHSNGLGALS